jgi:high affinity sulfate transporter 1
LTCPFLRISIEARWRDDEHVLQGLLPIDRSRVGPDVLAGVTLAALGVPEVLGYAKIAGMPLVTGLYTLLLPMAVFAILGSSRHLVVAADSATAAIMAAALAGLAAPGSERYVRLAGLAALLAGAMLLLARLVRLGFLADFLSRTVLVGFLTGVGIQVAVGQLPDMLGVSADGQQAVPRLIHTVRALPGTHLADLAVSAVVIVVVVTARLINRRIPGALIAAIIAIVVSRAAGLAHHGAAVVGSVPGGLPDLGLPALGWADDRRLLGAALSMFVVILAQSAATSRAYAVKYSEPYQAADDLVGLGAANAAAAFSGTFVVNGSPTKAQMVDGAGGRSQLAQLAASAVVLIVLLLLTAPLAYLPTAALAAVVFGIAAELIDVRGLRRILAVRRPEFAVALVTTAAVVTLGVEYGIVLAVIASIVDHLRHSYNPLNSVLVKSPAGHWRPLPVTPGARTEPGIVIYRFGTSLYYANAARLLENVSALADHGPPLRWLVLDCTAVGDIDFTASAVLAKAIEHVQQHQVRFVVSDVLTPVRHQLDRYGISRTLGPDACYDTPGEALEAFHDAGLLPGHLRDALGHGARRAQRYFGVTQPPGQHGPAVAHAPVVRVRRAARTVAGPPFPGHRGAARLDGGPDRRINLAQRIGGGGRDPLPPLAHRRHRILPGGGELPGRAVWLTAHAGIFSPRAEPGQRRRPGPMAGCSHCGVLPSKGWKRNIGTSARNGPGMT